MDSYGLVPLVFRDGFGGFLPQRPYIRRGPRRGFAFGLPAHRSLDELIWDEGFKKASSRPSQVYSRRRWQNGLHEGFKKVAANQLVTFREGAGVIPSKGWPTRTKGMTSTCAKPENLDAFRADG